MYMIFRWSLLFLFQSFTVNTALNKESLKKSLGQVSKFLENVSQSIQHERNYLKKVTCDQNNKDKDALDKNANNQAFNSNKFTTLSNKIVAANAKLDNLLHKYEEYYLSKDSKAKTTKKTVGGLPSPNANVTEIYDDIIDRQDTTTTLNPEDYEDYAGPPLPSYADPTTTTSKASTAYETKFKSDMYRLGLGVFSTVLMKMFHWVTYRKPEDTYDLIWGIATFMRRRLDSFGQPAKDAFMCITVLASQMPVADRKAQAELLHKTMQNRKTMISEEMNSILDYTDNLYLKNETEDVINSMEPLETLNNFNDVPFMYLETYLENIMAPWTRLNKTYVGETLRDNLNRAIKRRMMFDKKEMAMLIEEFMRHFKHDMDPIEEDMDRKIRSDPTKIKIPRERIISRKHVKVDDRYYNGQKQYDNVVKNGGNGKRRNDKNLKIIHWVPDLSYRTNKDKNVQKHTKAKDSEQSNVDDDILENDYERIMNEITKASRSVTTRPRIKGKTKNKRKFEMEKKPHRSQDSSKDQDIDGDPDDHSDNGHSDNDRKSHSGLRSTKKHHKKRHRKHRHKHSISSRGLAKLLKIIKYLRPHHKREKHRKHHHRSSDYWRRSEAVSRGNENTHEQKGKTSKDSKDTFNKANKNNKFYYETGKPTKFVIPKDESYRFGNQAYDKSNLGFRKSMAMSKDFKKVQALQKKIRAESAGSDEEIVLKMNLLKAMGGEEFLHNVFRGSKKVFDASKYSTDEEMLLKSQIYKYFNTDGIIRI